MSIIPPKRHHRYGRGRGVLYVDHRTRAAAVRSVCRHGTGFAGGATATNRLRVRLVRFLDVWGTEAE